MTRGARAARILWIALAIVVWQVVFDRVIVVAARQYVHAASVAAASGRYLAAGEWMSAAATRGVWLATAAAAAIVAAGWASIALTVRRHGRGDST